MKKELIYIITALLMLFLTIQSALAFTVDSNTFYSKEDIPSMLQETAIGQQLSCASIPLITDKISKTKSFTETCAGAPALIDKYISVDNGNTWIFQQEYQAPINFASLNVNASYIFECYLCPAGTLCTVSGQIQQINSNSYAVCTSQNTIGGNPVLSWKECDCTSDQFFNVVSKACENNPACEPSWKVTSWSDCTSGTQTRSVTDKNSCNDNSGKPATSQSCTVQTTNSGETTTTQTPTTPPPQTTPDVVQSPPTTPNTICNENSLACIGGNLKICQNGDYVDKMTCINGCGVVQGSTDPSCIKTVSENDFSLIIIICAVIFLLAIVVIVVLRRSKK